MAVEQYFPTTRITFSKGKQNLSKLFASPIYYVSLCTTGKPFVLLYKWLNF